MAPEFWRRESAEDAKPASLIGMNPSIGATLQVAVLPRFLRPTFDGRVICVFQIVLATRKSGRGSAAQCFVGDTWCGFRPLSLRQIIRRSSRRIAESRRSAVRIPICCGNPYPCQSVLLGKSAPRYLEHPSGWRKSRPVDNAESRSLYYEIGIAARTAVRLV